MKILLTAVAALTVTTAPGAGAPHLLRVELDTAALSALPSTCFRTPTTAPVAAPVLDAEQGLTWVLRGTDESGWSLLEPGASSFVLGDAGRVTLPRQLAGAEARFLFQTFQARVEGRSVIARHTAAEVVFTPGEAVWTGTLTLSARDGCRGGTCQLSCEVMLPFTATPVRLELARASR